jgi:hypothetical protein
VKLQGGQAIKAETQVTLAGGSSGKFTTMPSCPRTECRYAASAAATAVTPYSRGRQRRSALSGNWQTAGSTTRKGNGSLHQRSENDAGDRPTAYRHHRPGDWETCKRSSDGQPPTCRQTAGIPTETDGNTCSGSVSAGPASLKGLCG